MNALTQWKEMAAVESAKLMSRINGHHIGRDDEQDRREDREALRQSILNVMADGKERTPTDLQFALRTNSHGEKISLGQILGQLMNESSLSRESVCGVLIYRASQT